MAVGMSRHLFGGTELTCSVSLPRGIHTSFTLLLVPRKLKDSCHKDGCLAIVQKDEQSGIGTHRGVGG
jgi:hypothetical protein